VEYGRLMGCLEFIIFDAVAKEHREATFRNNSFLFVLIGNPGVIWHPVNNQCVQTKLHSTAVSGGEALYDPSRTAVFFFLSSF
jgi:hypothetical protein